jgi:hypothetical protein
MQKCASYAWCFHVDYYRISAHVSSERLIVLPSSPPCDHAPQPYREDRGAYTKPEQLGDVPIRPPTMLQMVLISHIIHHI